MTDQYPSKLMLPSEDGYSFYEIDKIIRCEAKDDQTWFYILNKSKPACVSIPMKKYETTLADTFYKVQKNHLINLNHVSKYFLDKQGFVLMTDGSRVKVADTRKEKLMSKLKQMVRVS
ncbi:MAG: LytTR family transcriptional regulator [Bacteroidales bacterium]|nr:LytTR family transcriptional regulator [Bacteroidales bacterium]